MIVLIYSGYHNKNTYKTYENNRTLFLVTLEAKTSKIQMLGDSDEGPLPFTDHCHFAVSTFRK